MSKQSRARRAKVQNVKVIDLIGGQVNEVEFDTFSGCYLVKNFSEGAVKF